MSESVETPVEDVVTPEVTSPPTETFGLEYVQQLRGEAAKYRTEKKDAIAAAEAKVREEFEGKLTSEKGKFVELEGKLGASEVELTKLRTALELGVPSDKVLQFAEILKGVTEDEIKSSAEGAKELFGGFKTTDPAIDHSQGSGGRPIPLNGDPILAAIKAAVGA